MGLHVETTTRDTACIIHVKGDVDLYSSPTMRTHIFDAIKTERSQRVIVELTHVAYMDSSGIATLVEGLQLAKSHHTRFILVGLSSKVMEVFQLARLERVFTISATVDDVFETV